MNSPAITAQAEFDHRLRRFTYEHTVESGRAPTIAEAARALHSSEQEARRGYERLTQSHSIMLDRESGELWRIAPFSAVPTAFPVHARGRVWHGNCIWDALGILAAMHADGELPGSCACCNQPITLQIRGGQIQPVHGLAHFVVPARRWYEDLVFT